MGYVRRNFGRGWLPSADSVNCPVDGLLRADNLIQDEVGAATLRLGSSKINSVALADIDIHSLFTAVISGTRYRYAGATNAVYRNGTSILSGIAGSNDIAFQSAFGQVFMARSTTKKKDSGTTLTNWGIAAPGAAPTVAAVAGDTKTFASGTSAEAPGFLANEGTVAFQPDLAGTANASAEITPDATTGRGTMTKTFAAATDFTVYDGAQVGTDDDLIDFYAYVTEPQYIESILVYIDVNDGTFQEDYYFNYFKFAEPEQLTLPNDQFLDYDYTSEGFDRRDVEYRLEDRERVTSDFRADKPVVNAGWTHFSITRGNMSRGGLTTGKNWSTVKAVRVVINGIAGGSGAAVRIANIKILGGSQRPLTGFYKYAVVAIGNNGTYTAKSAPSALSIETSFKDQSAQLTIDNTTITNLDSQVNELWVFRMGGALDAFYRCATKTGGPFAGAQTINDQTSDRDVLIADIRLERNNAVPPDSIVSIEGRHYDRIFALTATYLYPSQPLNPDSFDSTEVIRVCGADETAYWVKKVNEELYVGTSKDIYRFAGDWTKQPDGDLTVVKIPLGVGNPPIGNSVAQEGNTLLYLAADGWRLLGASGNLNGPADLLYRGYTRHGVSPVNITSLTARFRASMAKGFLVAVTPEASDTTSSATIHRLRLATQGWYRHTYPQAFRSIFTEPDGTLIAGDGAGFVWILDSGTQDGTTDIPVVMWTGVDDDGLPNNRKDGWNHAASIDTGGNNAAFALHLDGSGAAAASFNLASSGLGDKLTDISAIAAFRRLQRRITGSFSTFKFYSAQIDYRERPTILTYHEDRPKQPAATRRRFGGLTVEIDTLGGDATVTPILDGTALTPVTVNTSVPQVLSITVNNAVGRDLWAKISKATGFEIYAVAPKVLETLPEQFQGQFPRTDAGYEFEKVMTGIEFKVCTLNAAVTFTPIVDGSSSGLPTLAKTTGADEPETFVLRFTAAKTGIDVSFSTSGPIELYSWRPLVLYKLQEAVRVWENKPLVPSGHRRRFGGFNLQIDTGGVIATIVPVLDGVDQTTLSTTTADILGKTLTFSSVVGRDLWLRITSAGNFRVIAAEPIILEDLPQAFKGLSPRTNAGYEFEKVLTGIRFRACTLGQAVTFTPILDGVSTSLPTLAHTSGADEPDDFLLQFTSPQTATDIAFSCSGDIELYNWAPEVLYKLPMGVRVWENKPMVPANNRRRFGGFNVQVDTGGNPATLTPVLDGVDQPSIASTTTNLLGKTITFNAVVGRDLWVRITAPTSFKPYSVTPIILEELPGKFKGQSPRKNSGYSFEKVLTGIRFKCCTLGVARTFTALLDGVSAGLPTLSQTTGADEPDEFLLRFIAPQKATEIAFSVDGDIELYEWEPEVLYKLPPGLTIWENKPMAASARRRRFGGFTTQIDTGGNAVSFTPVLDGADQTALATSTSDLLGKTLTFSAIVGRDLWCRVSGSTAFKPHTVEPIIIEELPQQFKGLSARTNANYQFEKVLTGIRFKACTLGQAVTFTPVLDGSSSGLPTLAHTSGADEPDEFLLQFTAPETATDIAFSVDKNIELYQWTPEVLYQLPPRIRIWENIPMVPSATRRRFGGLTLQIDTLGAQATVTPVLDGVDQTALAVTKSNLLGATLTFASIIGRDLWCRVSCATSIRVHSVNPIVIETLPQQFQGQGSYSNFGYDGEKVMSGLKFKVSTLGATRTFTPILDGVEFDSFTLNTDEPETYTYQFEDQQSATDIAFSVDGNIELYEFTPIVLYNLPRARRVWDSGEVDLGRETVQWVRLVNLKARANADITLTPYFDGVAQAERTIPVTSPGVTTVFDAFMPRGSKGRQARFIAKSTADFNPYWIEVWLKSTGTKTENSKVKVKATP